LLSDIQEAFKAKATDRLSSAELVEHLAGLEDRPWPEWRGKPLSKSTLARLLTPFGVFSGTIRLPNDRTAKGYYLAAFEDAFARYLHPGNVTTSQAYSHGDGDDFQNVTTKSPVTLQKTSQTYSHGQCDGVTFSEPLDGAPACEIEL
jgi:hypothetical protein